MPAYKRALVVASLENLALTVVRTLAGKGVSSVVAGGGPGRLLRLSRRCSAYERVAEDAAALGRAEEPALASASRLARERGVDLVVPVDVAGALFASRLRERLPGVPFFPFAEPETLRELDDKWTFHDFLSRHGVPTPATRLIAEPAQARGLPLPLVLKPTNGAGGEGVEVVFDAARREARLAGARPTLAQDFVPGEDVSMSFLADRGRVLAWSAHAHLPGGGVAYVRDEAVARLGRRIADAARYTGLANVDMRRARDGRVLVLECNPRFWGTYKYTLGLDVRFLERGLALMEGRETEPFAGAPVGLVPGLRAALRGRGVPAASRPYLAQKLSDPLPELYCGARALLGLRPAGP